jgi:hypothetical protein
MEPNKVALGVESGAAAESGAAPGVRRDTVGALRLRAGYANYLGNNPSNQGRDHATTRSAAGAM